VTLDPVMLARKGDFLAAPEPAEDLRGLGHAGDPDGGGIEDEPCWPESLL
jgi:hypothetical protein